MMAEITRKDLEKLNTVYCWLAECGEEYKDFADAVRKIHYICQQLLDERETIHPSGTGGDSASLDRKATEHVG